MHFSEKASILLVDDKPANLLALEAVLEPLGDTLVRCSSGEQAVALVEKQEFAIIILDVHMPIMDGFETARRIRSLETGRYTPLLYLTSSDPTNEILEKAYAQGAADFIVKPFEPHVVASKVKVFCDLYKLGLERKYSEAEARRKSERALENQSRITQTIAENATSCLFMVDASGHCSFMNPAAERVTGYTFLELRGRVLHDMIHHSRPDGTPLPIEDCPLEQVLPRKSLLRGHEDYFIRKDGSFFPVLCAASPIIESGKPSGIVIEVRDVTDEKRAEEELAIARDKALEASQAKSSFLANMSHELRTPLNAVIGYAEMLQDELLELGQYQMAQDVDKIRLSGSHLLTVISDVLDLSKIEAGKMELIFEEFNVEQVIREAVALVSPMIEKNGNSIAINCDRDTGRITTDRTRFRQILFNLLSNAAKFTDKGTVTVTSRRVTMNGAPNIELKVSDDGIGMTTEQLERLFEKFRQGDTSSTKRFGGTGLGLAISKLLCRLMKASIEADSQVGKGSTFTLIFPVIIDRFEKSTTDLDAVLASL